MKRTPEPELMTDPVQAEAYAKANFETPHAQYIELFQDTFGGEPCNGTILDLGCGPGDISFRVARAFPGCTVHGVDGAESMLRWANIRLQESGDVQNRLRFFLGLLPDASLPHSQYDAVISNSLLHHLTDPQVLWQTIKRCARCDAPVFVMDLLRPGTRTEAEERVEQYAEDEPAILQRDFYFSLLAAFEIEEIKQQLSEAGLSRFQVEQVSDRHVIIYGRA